MRLSVWAAVFLLAAGQLPVDAATRELLSVEYFKKKITFDKVQEEKMSNLLFEYNKAKVKWEGDIQYLTLEFLDLFNADKMDDDKLEAKYKEVTKLQAEFGSHRIKKLMEAGRFLDQEQYAKYRKMLLKIFVESAGDP